jgi:hypothetical protein
MPEPQNDKVFTLTLEKWGVILSRRNDRRDTRRQRVSHKNGTSGIANRSTVPNLEKQLKTYALAAATAGTGLLTFSGAARASVVYVPTQISLANGHVDIDLDADGVTDFTLVDRHKELSFYSNRMLGVSGATGANVVKGNGGAAAMQMNSVISSGRAFLPVDKVRGRMASIGYRCVSSSACQTFLIGPWKEVKNKYLGFKFTTNGETHFGWARLNVTYVYQAGGNSKIKVYLSGYAYETVPGMAINAGQTAAADSAQVRGSLGQLARGAAKYRRL